MKDNSEADKKTRSEAEFERFLAENDLPFKKIEEQVSPRPDYLVYIGGERLVFEVKELSEDENFKTAPFEVSRRIVGEHIRRKIEGAQKQVQFGAKELGLPSVLLIYNNLDPMHLFGTEETDFIAAMYGEYTVLLNRSTLETLDSFQGRNSSLGEDWNTSFSAVGHLYPIRGRLKVTLYENCFAKVKMPFDVLPSCFDVKRVELELHHK